MSPLWLEADNILKYMFTFYMSPMTPISEVLPRTKCGQETVWLDRTGWASGLDSIERKGVGTFHGVDGISLLFCSVLLQHRHL